MLGVPNILIVEARFYQDIADSLVDGAVAELDEAGASHERVSVPGVLEIPAAIEMARKSGRFDGYVALGCVIRGETTHYDIVANESARAIMDLSVKHRICVGNGILTVENGDQAWARADPERKNKGGEAARAALVMIDLKKTMAKD